MTNWRDAFRPEEREVFEASGYGQSVGFGTKPAVLVIDVNRNFLGDRPEPIIESIRRFPYSCGLAGWAALPPLKQVLEAARRRGAPVVYTTGRWTPAAADMGVLAQLNRRHAELTDSEHTGYEIAPDVAPEPSDIMIEKHYPSMFFGTPLISYLTYLSIDTLLITGTSTSGCVRATTVDAYSYNFRTTVVEDCVFDRSESSHIVSLIDLDMKYADVLPSEAVIEYLSGGGISYEAAVDARGVRV